MLEFLITSASRRKILTFLLDSPDGEYHLRELSRKTGRSAPVVKRELDRLEQMGFILSWNVGNQRFFKVKKSSLFFPELKSLMEKEARVSRDLRVVHTFDLKRLTEERRLWQKRSMEVAEGYGKDLKRRRPRHPAEERLLEKLS
jgi:DNA-binding MarR family transcriptional regulator